MKFKIVFPTGYNIKDITDDNIDINLIICNGDVYFGTLFTVKNIQRLIYETNDVYFWATDMVVLKDLSMLTIRAAIAQIINDSYLEQIFTNIGKIEEVLPGNYKFEDINENAFQDLNISRR